MNITIKESMLIRKCLGAYVSSQLLDFDKSPLFMDLITKLKEFENYKIEYNQCNNIRNSLNKELKKYSIQTTCNKKILELMQKERIELVIDDKVIN